MNRLDRMYDDGKDAGEFARRYLELLAELASSVDQRAIARFIEILLDARRRGARIFFIGNGGSAATASHFANDIAIGTRSFVQPFRAVSLTDNLAILTAIANDDGYDNVFVRQLQTQMARGDVVVAISASGNSPNVVRAVEWANANGATTVALTGFDGGRLRALATHAVHVPTAKGEYGPVEDMHMVVDHLVSAYLARRVRSETTAGVSTR
jgi:D-sedoheptulose 7-phosphate isomerase